ncbi:MAG TPA: glycosyltransferase family 39 protein [Solirubrobacteraceae bacterium]
MAARTGGLQLPSPLPARPRTRGALPLFLARNWALLTLVAIVALGAGLRVHQAATPGRYLSADERSYARIAMSLADQGTYAADGLADPWHWAPGTPALFAAAHLLAPGADGDGSPQQLRSAFWAQAAVGSALIVVVFLLAAGIGGPIAGLLAAGTIAAYPPLATATGDLVSEPFGALTLGLALLALLGAWRRPTWRRLALTGAALGLALLVRADILVLPALLGVAWVLLARRRTTTRAALAQGAVIALVPLLVAAPWIAYASGEAGRLIPVASSGPSTLFVGTYLPGQGGLSGTRRVLEPYVRRHMSNLHAVPVSSIPGEFVLRAYIRERHPELVPGPYRAIPETALRHALTFEAERNLKTYAVGQPVAYAGMELRKVARMWGGYYRGGTRNPRDWLTAWHRTLLGLALAGALAGLLLARRRRPELALLLVPVLASTAVNVAFVAQPRHNLPVLGLLVAAGAAGGVLALLALRSRRGGLPPEADPPGDQITVERRALDPEIVVTRRSRTRA